MSDASSVVNATAPNTTADTGSGEGDIPLPAKITEKFDNPFDKALYELNRKYGGADDPQFKSLNQIVADVEAEAKPKPKAKEKRADGMMKKHENPSTVTGVQHGEGGEVTADDAPGVDTPPQLKKEKIKVDGKEYELDSDQLKRLAQKGIYLDKKNVEIAKAQRALEAQQAQFQQQIQSYNQAKAEFEADPAAWIAKNYGEDVARQKLEPWVGKQVMRDIEYEKNPHQRMIDEATARAQRAEAQLQAQQQQFQQQEIQGKTQQYQEQYQKTIIDALTKGGVPQTDFTAAEMAGHMQRALERGIEVTPDQLAQIVRDDNIVRVRSLVGKLSEGITQAKKANDGPQVLKLGQQIAEVLGDDVVYALGKYHLAKIANGRPAQPKQVFETPRNGHKEEPKVQKQYKSWEEYHAEVKKRAAALERGEQVPDWD